MVVTLKRPNGLPTAEQLAAKVIGKDVFVNWPTLHEARVRTNPLILVFMRYHLQQ
jgi:Exoribonuclease Xrn1 D1 domain